MRLTVSFIFFVLTIFDRDPIESLLVICTPSLNIHKKLKVAFFFRTLVSWKIYSGNCRDCTSLLHHFLTVDLDQRTMKLLIKKAMLKGLAWLFLGAAFSLQVRGQSNIVFQSDFEGPSINLGWDAQEACCSHSLTTTTTFKRTGNRSLRVELRKSDPDVWGNKRVELTDNSWPIPPETNRRWWSFSNYLPAGFQRDSVHEILAQWHHRATSKNISLSPPLSLQIYKGDWIVELRYDSVDINVDNGSNIRLVRFNLGPWQAGVWNDWVFNYNYSPNTDGFLQVWKNGKLVLDYKGRSYYRGSYDPFFKIGLYRWVWHSTWPSRLEQSILSSRVYYVDNVKLGNKDAILEDFIVPSPQPSNVPPIAYSGNKQTIPLPYTTATLRGSTNSMDPDGSIASWQWFVEQGPNRPVLQAANVPDLRISGMVLGKYKFRLMVTDNQGASSSSTTEIDITGSGTPNLSPIINLGTTRKLKLPANSISLGSSGTYDPDGSILSYLWSQESGPAPATLANTNSATLQVGGLRKGSYYFKLVVTDNKGGVSTGYVHVFVDGEETLANIPPVANAGSDQVKTLPDSTATLSGTASVDQDGLISQYQWRQLNGPSAAWLSAAASSVTSVAKLQAGTYAFELAVTDNSGARDADTVRIVVNPAPVGENIPPVSNAGSNQTFPYQYNTITMRGGASYDPDGTIISYRWSQDSGPAVLLSNPDSVINVARNVAVSGVYVFRLTVTDDRGLMNSSTITVTLLPALDGVSGIPQPNLVPIAEAGNDASFELLWNTITLDGRQSRDPDGSLVAYQWIQESGPSLAIDAPAAAQTVARDPVPGTYVFRLSVTDNKGSISSDVVTYTILPSSGTTMPDEGQNQEILNIPPTANAGNTQTFQLQWSTITMNGSQSNDADGSIVAYQWTQVSGPTVLMSYPDSVINVARNIVVGNYEFRLVVTDDKGATDTAFLLVNVLPVTSSQAGGYTAPVEEVLLNPRTPPAGGVVGVYPNPVAGSLVIRLENINAGRIQVRILNLMGATLMQEVFDHPGATLTRKLQLPAMKPGTYLLQLVSGGKTILSKKLLKLD